MKLTLATKIFLGNALVTLTFGAVSVYSVLQMRQTGGEIRLISEGYLSMAKATARLDTLHRSRQRDSERLLAESNPETRIALIKMAQGYNSHHIQDRFHDLVNQALSAKTLAVDETEAKLLGDLSNRFGTLASLCGEYERAAGTAFSAIAAENSVDRGSAAVEEFVRLERQLGREIKVMALMLDQQVAKRVDIAAENERQSTMVIIALSIFAIMIGLLATFQARHLLKPIQMLTVAVRKMGDDPGIIPELPLNASNEIGLLANAIHQLAQARKNHEKALMEKQEELVRAERLAAIGRISAQITHEIRNPLSSIGLNAELLQEDLAEGGDMTEAREILDSIIRELGRLKDISEQYLTFARFPQPVMAKIQTAEFLDEILNFHESELQRANVQILRKYPQSCPAIIGDEGQLKQAILNLIRNSREALVHGGTISVDVKPLVTQIEISIADDGPGIEPEALKKMFDPFFSTKQRGTGLGLSLTQQIISSHSGELNCASELGRGTTFTIRLKRA